jgi:hypothetical protein
MSTSPSTSAPLLLHLTTLQNTRHLQRHLLLYVGHTWSEIGWYAECQQVTRPQQSHVGWTACDTDAAPCVSWCRTKAMVMRSRLQQSQVQSDLDGSNISYSCANVRTDRHIVHLAFPAFISSRFSSSREPAGARQMSFDNNQPRQIEP